MDRSLSLGLERFRLPDGRIAFANTRAPRFGGGVGRFVQGVVGLDDLRGALPVAARAPASPRPRDGPAHASVRRRPPSGVPAAVDEASGLTPSRRTSSRLVQPLRALRGRRRGRRHHDRDLRAGDQPVERHRGVPGLLRAKSSVSYLQVDGGSPSTFNGEADEDIEIAMGFAPKATIDVFQAPDSLRGPSTTTPPSWIATRRR